MMDQKLIFAALAVGKTLDDLAALTKNGFIPFSACTAGNRAEWENKIVYLDEAGDGSSGMSENDVLSDVAVDEGRRDAVGSYGGILSDVACGGVSVKFKRSSDPDDPRPYIDVAFERVPGASIVVEDGAWTWYAK